MAFAMVVPVRPISMDARFKDRYQARLQAEARHRLGGRQPLAGDLYIRILWLHRQSTTQDIDNIAKRIVDALKGTVYDDDNTIVSCLTRRIRYATDTVILSEQADSLQETIDEMIALIGQEESHILYIEVGQVESRQIMFGPAL